MNSHHKTNSVCRFLADNAEVRTFWRLGDRDPYLVQSDGVPITWTELNSRVDWRNRLHIVRFRLWTAVSSPGLHRSRHRSTTSAHRAPWGQPAAIFWDRSTRRNNGTEPAARIGVGADGIHHCGGGEGQRAGGCPGQV